MDDEVRSRVAALRRDPDAGTRLPMGPIEPRFGGRDLAQAWSALVPGLSLVPGPDAPGYRLFWTRHGNTGFRDFPLTRSAHLVLGRHSMSDVILADDPDLSLRHLLVMALPDQHALRLVDLDTFVPLFLEGDHPYRALVLRGPFALRLGRYVLGGFPVGRDVPGPPATLPVPELVEDDESAPPGAESPASLRGEGPYRAAQRRSVITLMPQPLALVDASVASEGDDACLLMTAARAGERARLVLSRRDLRAGLLVGRHPKCADRGLKPLLTDGVSRVHLAIIDTPTGPRVYDTASSNGTFVKDQRVRGLAIEDDTPPFRLAGSSGLEIRLSPLSRGSR